MGTQHLFGVVAIGITVWSIFSHEKPPQLPENPFSGRIVVGRVSRAEVFESGEVIICHVFARVVRRCFIFANDPVPGKNYDQRKVWIEQQLQRLAANFEIDLLCFHREMVL